MRKRSINTDKLAALWAAAAMTAGGANTNPALLLLACLSLTLIGAPAALAGYIQVSAQTELRMKRSGGKDSGELTITPAAVEFHPKTEQDRTETYLWISGDLNDGLLSMATLICFGERFAGYKGFNITLQEVRERTSIGETLALGLPGRFVRQTHPWLFRLPEGSPAGERPFSLEDLCTSRYREKMKAFNVESWTERTQRGDFTFQYAPGGLWSTGRLEIRWKKQ